MPGKGLRRFGIQPVAHKRFYASEQAAQLVRAFAAVNRAADGCAACSEA
jgi:hypothetical protein